MNSRVNMFDNIRRADSLFNFIKNHNHYKKRVIYFAKNDDDLHIVLNKFKKQLNISDILCKYHIKSRLFKFQGGMTLGFCSLNSPNFNLHIKGIVVDKVLRPDNVDENYLKLLFKTEDVIEV